MKLNDELKTINEEITNKNFKLIEENEKIQKNLLLIN